MHAKDGDVSNFLAQCVRMLLPRRVTISISPAAFAAIASTLPKGTADGSPDGQGGYLLTLDRRVLDRLAATRHHGESYSEVILRLAKGARRS
jgi:hypothetical protein